MTGLICAMEVELEKILSMMEDETVETVSDITFHRGRIGDKEIVCAVCGVGKVFAAMCAQTMILKYAPEAVINVGVAGSLDKRLHIADIVIALDLVQHDMDVTPLGLPRGQILNSTYRFFSASEEVSGQLSDAIAILNRQRQEAGGESIGVLRGRIASGDQFVVSAQQKEDIVSAFGAAACEMEGAAIAQVCCVNSMPFAVLRAISDSADDNSHMDYPEFTRLAAANTAEVIRIFCNA